jgi:hypothetical protein
MSLAGIVTGTGFYWLLLGHELQLGLKILLS